MPKLRPLSLLPPALLVIVALGASDSPATAGFTPPPFRADVSSTVPGAAADIEFHIPIPQGAPVADVTAVNIPGAWDIAPGDSIPIGTPAGFIDTETTLGLLNAPCNQVLPIHWDFQNASTNPASTVGMGDEDSDFFPDFSEDDDGDGIFNGIEFYPDFLLNITAEAPLRRLAAITIVAGIPYLYQVITFDPGTALFGLPSGPSLGILRSS